MGKMFDLLKEGLEEAIAYEKGLSKNVRVGKARIDTSDIPQHPKEYHADDIKRLRNKLNFSQNIFAAYLNVSLNTIQSWEQGARKPNHSALRLLEIFDKGFSFVEELFKETKITSSKRKGTQTAHKQKISKASRSTKIKH